MEYPFKDLLPLDEVLAREGYYKDWTHLDPEVFYSLTQISEYIKTKGYGVDVRLLIAQLAEHFGLNTTQVVDLGNLIQAEHSTLKQQVQEAVAHRIALETQFNQSVAQMQADKNAVIANVTVDSEVILARGGKPSLQARLDDTTAQLVDAEKSAGEAFAGNTIISPPVPTRKAYMTIVDDDASLSVLTKLKPISEDLGVPITLAVPVSYPWLTQLYGSLSKEQLLDLQNNLGWEMASHSSTHEQLRTMTTGQLEYELHDSKKVLKSWGLNIKNFVAPFGSNDVPKVREISAKYYNCGVQVGGGINVKPVKNQLLNRVALGSFTTAGQNTLEYYKSQVDHAIVNDGWLIFMTHCHEAEHNETQNQYLRDVILYAQSLGVEIVNLQDGFEKMGNMVEVEGVMSIGRDGNFYSEQGNQLLLKRTVDNAYKNSTPISDYENGELLITNISLKGNGGFPTQAGTLITNTTLNLKADYGNGYYYQQFRAYNSSDVYERYVKENGAWSGWVPNQLVKHTGDNTYKNSTPISDYEKGKILITNVSIAGNGGFPTQAGTLITNMVLHPDYGDGYYYQQFRAFNSSDVYERYVNVNGAWSKWEHTSDISVAKTTNDYTSNSLITDFPNGRITVFNTNLAGGIGFPSDNAGICTTYRIGGHGSEYQEYKEYLNWNKWVRFVQSDGTWSTWKQYSLM